MCAFVHKQYITVNNIEYIYKMNGEKIVAGILKKSRFVHCVQIAQLLITSW